MKMNPFAYSTLAALALTTAALSQPPPLRIMPLGDSITVGGNGGYRLPLYIALTNAGYNVDFVGTEILGGAPELGNEMHHEGHSGWRISYQNYNFGLHENILGWLAQIEDPDIVLLHVGTNDTNDPNFEDAINELDALIIRIATARPMAHIIATTLMKRGENDADPLYAAIARDFNPYVLPRVLAHQAQGRRVHFLDMHAALERSDMSDNLHPHLAGYAKMAAAWFPAVTNIAGHYGDALPPGISSVRAVDATTLTVTFSKPVNIGASPAVATPASYTLSPAGSVSAVSALSADQRKVTLSVSGLAPNARYSLAFNGAVTDLVPIQAGGPYSASLSGTAGSFLVPAVSDLAVDNLPAGTLNGWEPLYTLHIPDSVRYGLDRVEYSLDYSAAHINSSLTRVAYYMALQQNTDEPLIYVWVELDAFTQDAAKLGVPTIFSGALFQQSVANLTVISTSPNVTVGTFPTGNIEFWPYSYSSWNGTAIPGASDTLYDFGDMHGNSGEYGSMQIHNTAERETIFAFNQWGSASDTSFTPDIGIGNNPGEHPDWTFTSNSGSFVTKTLQVFIKRTNAPPPPAAIPPVEVTARIPDAANFRHLYTIDIPGQAAFNNAAARTSCYSVDNALALSANGQRMSRVAYYLELTKNNATSFCWTAFDSFTPDLTRLGVPCDGRVSQQIVANLDVTSNVAGVINTNNCATGNIEFWPYDYAGINGANIPGASGDVYDFGDMHGSSGNYGSMQVHNYGAGQTLWALNCFNNYASVDIGIGNSPGDHSDWTFSFNGGNWDTRRLLVFVRPVATTVTQQGTLLLLQ